MKALLVASATTLTLLLSACGSPADSPGPTEASGPATGATASTAVAHTPAPAEGQAAGAKARTESPARAKPKCKVGPKYGPDGIKRWWTKDKRCYHSPWFKRAHRITIGFGCTAAPYYAPHPNCSGGRGRHHGIDIDMPVGTRLYSNVRGRIVKGTLGSAYGNRAFIVRTKKRDYVIGHVRRALVDNGQRVRRGTLIARSGQRGAPDGPHLHFEVRPVGGPYTDALRPRKPLRLTPKK